MVPVSDVRRRGREGRDVSHPSTGDHGDHRIIRRGQEQGRLWRDVDPEAYVAHVTLLVLGSIATFECVAALAPKGPDNSPSALLERHTHELLRIARTSLFRPPRRVDAEDPRAADPTSPSTTVSPAAARVAQLVHE